MSEVVRCDWYTDGLSDICFRPAYDGEEIESQEH